MFLSIINLECEVSQSHAETTSTRTELNNSTTETKHAGWDLYLILMHFLLSPAKKVSETAEEILLKNFRFVELSKQLRSENSPIKGELSLLVLI